VHFNDGEHFRDQILLYLSKTSRPTIPRFYLHRDEISSSFPQVPPISVFTSFSFSSFYLPYISVLANLMRYTIRILHQIVFAL